MTDGMINGPTQQLPIRSGVACEPVPLEYSIDRLICAFASSHSAVMVG
jgi:hypothetical protein